MEKMAGNPFSFLDSQLEKEAHIYDILREILRKQEAYLITREGSLATLTELLNSRNIKIPHSSSRNKNIVYLTDMLCKKHPKSIKSVLSFSFTANKETKKLNIDETVEFSVNLDEDIFAEIKYQRDAQTKRNILELLSMFRTTNLTRLLKNSSNGNYLINLLQEENERNIFFYKQYAFDNHLVEISENHCFHKKNYGQLKRSLSVDEIKKIISKYSTAISRKMKSFGIMNINISDYTDTKLDYLIRALMDELSVNADKRDMIAVKNFAALRECLIKVDQTINPLISLASNIVAYIRKNSVCSAGELAAVFPPLTLEDLSQWAKDDLDKMKILTYNDGDSLFFVDPQGLIQKLGDLHKIIIDQHNAFAAMSETEKKKSLELLEILYNSGLALAASEKSFAFLGTETGVQRLNKLLKSFEEYKKNQKVSLENRSVHKNEKHASIVKKMLNFITSLFAKNVSGKKNNQSGGKAQAQTKKPLSKFTKDIISKIKERNTPLIPLSDYIELNRENEKQIDSSIDEIRQHNLKIVIPVYNARTVLYPAKSSGYIISDIEYLMTDPDVISSADSIRDFTDSLAGYKVKDEAIPGRAILIIENYLLTLYRQKKIKKVNPRNS